MKFTEEFLGLMVRITRNGLSVEGILVNCDKGNYHISLDGGYTTSQIIPIEGSTIVCEEIDTDNVQNFYTEMEKLELSGKILMKEPDTEQ